MKTAAREPLDRLHDLLRSRPTGGQNLEPFWLEEIRKAAAKRFTALDIPVRKEEAWRYTRVESLLAKGLEVPAGPAKSTARRSAVPLQADAHHLVLVDGCWSEEFSRSNTLPQGVWAGSLRQAILEGRLAFRPGEISGPESHIFAALNTAFLQEGVYIQIPAGLCLEHPIELLHLATEEARSLLTLPRVMVVLEEGAEAVLVERFGSIGQPHYFSNMVAEILLRSDSRLEHYRQEEELPNARHMAGLHVRQERASSYHLVTATGGAAWTRTELTLTFAGKGAEAQLDGLYVCGDEQLTDIHLDIRHQVPGCTSRERFKGILHGSGRAVFDGRILVDKQAQQSDARLSNDNLLLSRNAEVDSKPQLEIFADDVVCSHGTTVGQLDDEMLFYLRARGLGEEDARQMLCEAFAGEILDAIRYPPLREHTQRQLRQRLIPAGEKEE